MDAGVAASAAAISISHPAGGPFLAGASPVLAAGLKSLLGRLSLRRQQRPEYVLAWFARLAHLDPAELEARCLEKPELEQLLLRILAASEQTTLPEKLVAYALSLAASVNVGNSTSQLRWETAFVEALSELDVEDLELLRRVQDPSEAHNHPLLDVPGTFSEPRLRELVGDSTTLPLQIAVLQRHGLIANQTAGGGPGLMGSEARTVWRTTKFGAMFLDRLAEVGHLLSPSEGGDQLEGGAQG